MNGVDRDSRDHRQVWEMIPWVVNGTASGEQRQQVELHALHCEDCGRELRFQRSLQVAMASAPAPKLDAQASLRRFQGLLDGETGAGSAGARMSEGGRGHPQPLPRRSYTRALLAAVLIEAVALAALGNAWWLQLRARSSEGAYQVLSAAPVAAPTATIRVVLAPAITAGDLQSLLLNAGLQIVGGPSDAGVYSLGPRVSQDPAGVRAALEMLRANAQVRFAEPVSDVAGPK